jgi:hypothetical protein
MRMLRDDWRANGLDVEYEEVDGVAHDEVGVLKEVHEFVLKNLR